MLKKIKFCWTIFCKSSKIIEENKKILIYPCLSIIFTGIALGTVTLMATQLVMENHDTIYSVALFLSNINFILLGLLIYLADMILVTIFNVALFSEIFEVLRGERASISRGFKVAFSHFQAIFLLVLVSCTVGIIISLLQYMTDKFSMKFYPTFLNLSWKVVSYFVLPVMIFNSKEINPFRLLKYSCQILNRNLGASITGFAGLKSLSVLGGIIWLGIVLLLAAICKLFPEQVIFIGSIITSLVTFFILLIYLFYISFVQKIYQAIIFAYATKIKIKSIWTKSEIINAFE